LVVFRGGMASGAAMGAVALDGATDPMAALSMLVPAVSEGATALSTGTVPMSQRAKAKLQGYEGEACGECGNYTLVRNGTCMKCNTCGATSGCS
jgi:ribonucleoside-diphosphate reductase alpha chain